MEMTCKIFCYETSQKRSRKTLTLFVSSLSLAHSITALSCMATHLPYQIKIKAKVLSPSVTLPL